MTYWFLPPNAKFKTEDEVFDEYGVKTEIDEITETEDGYKMKGRLILKKFP